jgi:hypothetical protein
MKEYLIQGLNNGEVEDCLHAYGIESAKDKMQGGWASWFESLILFDISNPMQPVKISTKSR